MVDEDLCKLNRSTFSSSKSISSVATYVFTSSKRLYKLIRRDQRSEYVDMEWINTLSREEIEMPFYDSSEITNCDNFGNLSKTGLTHRYIFFQGKVYFFNGVSLVYLDL